MGERRAGCFRVISLYFVFSLVFTLGVILHVRYRALVIAVVGVEANRVLACALVFLWAFGGLLIVVTVDRIFPAIADWLRGARH